MDATPHIIESALLLLAAFLLGCVVGYFARRMSGVRSPLTTEPPAPLAAVPPSPVAAPQSAAEAPAAKAPRAARAGPAKVSPRKKPVAAPKAASAPDDLKKIKGIGPRLEAALNSHGINRYAQIARLSKKAVAELDAELSLRGRIAREQWVEQAKALGKAGANE